MKTNRLIIAVMLVLFGCSSVFAQNGIGTITPAPSSILDLTATDKAFLLTRVASINSIATPVNGMMIYDQLNKCVRAYENNAWSDCLNGSIALPPDPQTCVPTTTSVVDIVSAGTGKTWMDRNLGAWRAATSSTDAYAYGDLYQFGRRKDGHQCRLSATTSTVSTAPQVAAPNTEKFITNVDWYSGPLFLRDFWNETNTGVNDVVCPTGYRLPLKAEWDAEIATWGANKETAAFNSIKLTLAGVRTSSGGFLTNAGFAGSYHSADAFSGVQVLNYNSTTAAMNNDNFGSGRSVRCIKN